MRLLSSICVALMVLWLAPVPVFAQILDFDALDGWYEDDASEALIAFRATCDALPASSWGPLCDLAQDVPPETDQARSFFELFFRPVRLDRRTALFTAYYEPVLEGSLVKTARFTAPLYRKPPELQAGTVFHSRSAIEAGALRGRGLEIAWLESEDHVADLQTQGSGRVRLTNGNILRLGYGGKNGHAFQVGTVKSSPQTAPTSVQAINAWLRGENFTVSAPSLAKGNPSYVFFRKLKDLPADKGPLGAMGRPLYDLRSIAVDPAYVALGTPVWIEKKGVHPLRRLMVAQDTGGMIKGPQRADIFYGTGDHAGQMARRVKDGGKMIVLLPIDLAYRVSDTEIP